jgi:biopolymer transport protein ExbB/TolQ
MDMSIWDIIRIGGFAMWVILGLSVLVVAVALERLTALWAFTDKARALADTVKRCLQRGAVAEGRAACERSQSPVADIFLAGFERMGRDPFNRVEAAVDRERTRVTLDLKVRMWMLATAGATAPFIGLGGTVIGIMSAFGSISKTGQGGFAVVSKGLSEALVATAAGIVVAVIAVIVYNALNQRIARVSAELRLLVEEFVEVVKDRQERGGAEDGARQAS